MTNAQDGAGGSTELRLRVNGVDRQTSVPDHESLLTTLRERLGLPGSKNACEQGECGSCSVLMDGDLVCSCLVLSAAAQGRDVRTVESLGDVESREGLHPIQRAFVEAGAVQCGFCTPGLIVSAYALLTLNPEPSELEVREALAGNLCRCTGYGKILEAVQMASKEMYRR